MTSTQDNPSPATADGSGGGRRRIRRLAVVTPILAGVVAIFAGSAAPALAATVNPNAATNVLIRDTNALRGSDSRGSLTVCHDLDHIAWHWANHMAVTRVLSHNPSLAKQTAGWTMLGENVGVGTSASALQGAFEHSAEHRANLLGSSYTQVGIETIADKYGRLWTDEVFRQSATPGCG